MNIRDFEQMYLTELQEIHSVEDQLSRALPKMAEIAHNPQLKGAIEGHLGETKSHVERVASILQRHNADPREHEDQSMQSIIGEANKWAHMLENPGLRDAGLIASAQRIEHYEIAVYGTLASWAKQLGHEEDADTLFGILEEEKSADERLTALAKDVINPQAA